MKFMRMNVYIGIVDSGAKKNHRDQSLICRSTCSLFLNKLKSFGTVVKRNKVPTTDIESVKIFDCILGIIDVLIDDKGSAFFIAFGAFADLSD
jgi:hypothetical protein